VRTMKTLQATTMTGGTTALSGETLRSFAERLRGSLLRPGDDGYDQARLVWNGMIDKHPALIARPANVADVCAGVDFARQHDLRLAVRGGGHERGRLRDLRRRPRP
jgi:hypothetical protein